MPHSKTLGDPNLNTTTSSLIDNASDSPLTETWTTPMDFQSLISVISGMLALSWMFSSDESSSANKNNTSQSLQPSSFLRFLVTALCFSGLAQRAGATDLTTNLVGYYDFNGNANDNSGNGNHGVAYSTTLTTDRFGSANSAYSFNGISSYIDIVNGNAFNFVNQFSLSLWIKPTAGIQVTHSNIISKSHNSVNGWVLEQNGVNNNNFYFGYYPVPGPSLMSCFAQLTGGSWNHLVITKQDTLINCYLDTWVCG